MADGDPNPSEISELIDRALEVEWYDVPGSDVDRAAYALCHLRRTGSLGTTATRAGDDVVRSALSQASHPALVWLTSRAISYLDESGFPEAIERRFPDDQIAST